MIPTLLLPFNLIKAVLNAALVLVIYKPVATALRHTRLATGGAAAQPYHFSRRSLLVLLLGLALIALSVALYLIVLDGTFVLWD